MRNLTFIAIAVAVAGTAAPALAGVETFDTTPSGFTADRHAPAGFTGGVAFAGDNRLQVSIAGADHVATNDAPPSIGFYNTQGMKETLGAGITQLSLDLYVDAAWANTGQRMAGFWATGVDNDDPVDPNVNVSAFPIIEFFNGAFRGYNVTDGSWLDLGLPTGFVYDAFYTLSMSLSGGTLTYTVGDQTASQDAQGTTRFGEAMVQGYNYGTDYSFYADNLTSNDVPEPAMLGLFGLGALGLAAARRRKA